MRRHFRLSDLYAALERFVVFPTFHNLQFAGQQPGGPVGNPEPPLEASGGYFTSVGRNKVSR